ncbi:undecaprenyl-diphosphatase 1 [Alphaproteobacteria bacterium]|nr:undecaprenyl-diphosphatase 1 [Alphaproteobacteria bacterium]
MLLLAAFLGLVEGMTEFLPVSSTGHLVLMVDLLGFKAPPGKAFEIVIQLGSILAVCILYWRRLLKAARGCFTDARERNFVLTIAAGFLPAMIVGAFAYPLVRRMLDSPTIIAVALIVGGFAILAIENYAKRHFDAPATRLHPLLAFKIGLFQVVAMIPGVSRSGATIMGALMLGVERKTATEFSFFLAIPTMFGAATYSIYKNRDVLSFDDGALIAVGFTTAFLSALIIVKGVIAFVGRHGFAPFAWYRIAIGALMLGILFFR